MRQLRTPVGTAQAEVHPRQPQRAASSIEIGNQRAARLEPRQGQCAQAAQRDALAQSRVCPCQPRLSGPVGVRATGTSAQPSRSAASGRAAGAAAKAEIDLLQRQHIGAERVDHIDHPRRVKAAVASLWTCGCCTRRCAGSCPRYGAAGRHAEAPLQCPFARLYRGHAQAPAHSRHYAACRCRCCLCGRCWRSSSCWRCGNGSGPPPGVAVATFVLTLAPLVLVSRLGVRLPWSFVVGITAFIFATIFLGEADDFYHRYWWWDGALHLGSALGFGIIGFLVGVHAVSRATATPHPPGRWRSSPFPSRSRSARSGKYSSSGSITCSG